MTVGKSCTCKLSYNTAKSHRADRRCCLCDINCSVVVAVLDIIRFICCTASIRIADDTTDNVNLVTGNSYGAIVLATVNDDLAVSLTYDTATLMIGSTSSLSVRCLVNNLTVILTILDHIIWTITRAYKSSKTAFRFILILNKDLRKILYIFYLSTCRQETCNTSHMTPCS